MAERLIGTGNHIVSYKNLGMPGSYREIFLMLSEHNIISEELSQKLQQWTGYPNILVHGYLKIDHSVAFEIIQDDFEDIEEFKNIVLNLLK